MVIEISLFSEFSKGYSVSGRIFILVKETFRFIYEGLKFYGQNLRMEFIPSVKLHNLNLLATDFFFKFQHTLYLKCE